MSAVMLLALLAATPGDACLARVDRTGAATLARCEALLPEAEAAAEAAQLPSGGRLLLGMALVESGCQALAAGGKGGEMVGSTQVAWGIHRALLTGAGVASWRLAVDPAEGLLAAGVVLGWLRAIYEGPRGQLGEALAFVAGLLRALPVADRLDGLAASLRLEEDRLLCVYGCGPRGLAWTRCEYSVCVRRAAARLTPPAPQAIAFR